MLELTDSACKELESYFADKEKSDIRIYLAPGGCCGPQLMLADAAAAVRIRLRPDDFKWRAAARPPSFLGKR